MPSPARAPAQPRALIDAALGEKVLHGWLQNRHQTLYPLTINFRTLAAEPRLWVLRLMAVALLAGAANPRAIDDARAWLRSAGANEADLAAMDAALRDPPSLSAAVAAVTEAGLGTYAYAVALIAAGRHDPVAELFVDYIGARFAVPDNVVRSIRRRFRL